MYDRYLKYEELTAELERLAATYPGLAKLESIGKTFEGRDIWLMTVSDPAMGSPESKKAFCMDGNIHGGEVASSMVVMETLNRLLEGYGKDEKITRLLRKTTVYAIPRIHADGAELYLTTPGSVRGSVEKVFPPQDGVVPRDLNGDGWIVKIRVRNPAGKWKVSLLDPRIMEERDPLDTEGVFYDLLPEGMLRGEDAIALRAAPPEADLDPNREFPFNWISDPPSENGQAIGGPAPLHDPETRALYEFVLAHPNICFEQNFHTFGGLHISPLDFCPEMTADERDAMAFARMGQALHRESGYQVEGIFPPGAKDIAHGSYTTWLYWERGITAYVTELWDWHKQCDPERNPAWSMFFVSCREQFEREQTSALKWDAEQNDGQGFMDWTPFEHPQLGPVEIGGWREKFTSWNPPVHRLWDVLDRGFATCMASLAAMPDTHIDSVRALEAKDGWVKLEIALSNRGFLPTASSQLAAKKGFGDLRVKAQIGDGTAEKQLIQMEGYSRKRVVMEIQGSPGEKVTVTLEGNRSGSDRWQGSV